MAIASRKSRSTGSSRVELVGQRLVAGTVLAVQGVPVGGEDHARAAVGAGEAVGIRRLHAGILRRQMVGVHDLLGLELAVQDHQRAARLGVVAVPGQDGLEQVAFFNRVCRDLAQQPAGLGARLLVVHHIQCALEVAAGEVELLRLEMEGCRLDQFVIVIGGHGVFYLLSQWRTHNGVGHAGHAHHRLDIVHADNIRAAGDAHGHGGGGPLQRADRAAGRGCSR